MFHVSTKVLTLDLSVIRIVNQFQLIRFLVEIYIFSALPSRFLFTKPYLFCKFFTLWCDSPMSRIRIFCVFTNGCCIFHVEHIFDVSMATFKY